MNKIEKAEIESAEKLIAQVKVHSMKGYIIGALENWANRGYPSDGASALDGDVDSGPGAPDIGEWKVERQATPELREKALDMAIRTMEKSDHANNVIWSAERYLNYILKGDQ